MRPVLVGMNNPLSDDPRYALYAAPEGCTGHRLYTMLAEASGAFIPRDSYHEVFDRRNVLSARQWSKEQAREAGAKLVRELADREVVVVGVQTCRALGLTRPTNWCKWVESEPHGDLLETEDRSLRYCLIPHASGRCREYNDPRMRRRVGKLLLGLYRGLPTR